MVHVVNYSYIWNNKFFVDYASTFYYLVTFIRLANKKERLGWAKEKV